MVKKIIFEVEKLIYNSLSLISILLIIDTALYHFLNLGPYLSDITIYYCSAFLYCGVKFKKKFFCKKSIMIPFYIMVLQTILSLAIYR